MSEAKGKAQDALMRTLTQDSQDDAAKAMGVAEAKVKAKAALVAALFEDEAADAPSSGNAGYTPSEFPVYIPEMPGQAAAEAADKEQSAKEKARQALNAALMEDDED